MAESTSIEWTDATWNPVSGCEHVSPGCDHCYAERFSERFRGVEGNYYASGFDVQLRPVMLARPALWTRPRRIFLCSMGDLFHRAVPDEYLDRVFDVMESVERHTYQVLTKRPERMRRYVDARYGLRGVPDHVWLGTSVESNDFAWRAEMLKRTRARTRFLSVEPMLGPVDRVVLDDGWISWVIVGGESGPGRRPMDVEWVRDVRDRCVALGVAFFFKQWGGAADGRGLDGRTWDEMPSVTAMRSSIEK